MTRWAAIFNFCAHLQICSLAPKFPAFSPPPRINRSSAFFSCAPYKKTRIFKKHKGVSRYCNASFCLALNSLRAFGGAYSIVWYPRIDSVRKPSEKIRSDRLAQEKTLIITTSGSFFSSGRYRAAKSSSQAVGQTYV